MRIRQTQKARGQTLDVLAAEDPYFHVSMGLEWAERMVVHGPPGPVPPPLIPN
jgi:hypothetical protein